MTTRARMPSSAVYVLLAPQFAISLLSWVQLTLSLNRYEGVRALTVQDMWALLVFAEAGLVRWVAVLSMRSASFAFQIVVGIVGATLGWTSFVIVFNRGFVLPTRQQVVALGMSVVITVLWEVNNRLYLEM